jgi:uncharacterized membrane protein
MKQFILWSIKASLFLGIVFMIPGWDVLRNFFFALAILVNYISQLKELFRKRKFHLKNLEAIIAGILIGVLIIDSIFSLFLPKEAKTILWTLGGVLGSIVFILLIKKRKSKVKEVSVEEVKE